MAKKSPAKPTKKTTTKAPAPKPAPPKKAAPAKPAPKASTKPTPKPTPKPDAKAPAKPSVKPAVAAKVLPKAAPAKAPPAKGASKPASKSPPAKGDGKPSPKPATAPLEDKKTGRKGITIVDQKPPPKKPEKKGKITSVAPPSVGRLLDPKNPITRKPLIPSGPKAVSGRPLGSHGHADEVAPKPQVKSPLGKRDLDRFRQILLRKRAELVGDVSQMETEALSGQSGSLSNLPQHMADQGSDTYDQSLALDLAAADRKLIKEIDDAIQRIDDGTFGVCQHTGKPIKLERLEELPWARYSIEAAREIERRTMWT